MGIWRLANILSFANALTGVLAIFFAAFGNLILAAHLIALAIFFDSLDGPVARWQGPTAEGKLLDRVSDRITQTIAPAVLLLVFSSFHPLAFILGVTLVFIGLLRLIRSDASQERPSLGLPLVPVALLIVAGVLVNILLPVLFVILIPAVILSSSTISLKAPSFFRKPVVSRKDSKQIFFIAIRSLPLLLLALPFSSLSWGMGWGIFFVMSALVAFGVFSGIYYLIKKEI